MNYLFEMPVETPALTVQERAETYGTSGLAEAELLSMLGLSLEQAAAVLHQAGDLAKLYGWKARDFERITGIGRRRAWALEALFELSRRALMPPSKKPMMSDPASIASYLQPKALGLQVEKLWVLSLNTRGRLISCAEVSSGTATASLVHPREVFREAIAARASGVVVSHNHPSGDPQPSAADIAITRQLKESARIIGIDFLDHVIMGTPAADPAGRGWYSFRTAGLV